MASGLTDELADQYRALREHVGWVDFRDRTQIEVTGQDRATFLHNFCTNDIKRLIAGSSCESFFTNAQGKILGYAYIFCRSPSLIVETVAGQAEPLIKHLERHLIREDVQLHDRSSEWGELLVAGPQAQRLLEDKVANQLPHQSMVHVEVVLSGRAVSIRRVDLVGPESFLLNAQASDIDRLANQLTNWGIVPCSREAAEICRIETGSPSYGIDITDQNLPQEVGRDDRAISLTKGCYLGQETVARIDALGHVNWRLVGLKFESKQSPRQGTPINAGEKSVGKVTSATFSPRLGTPLALGYVRREHSTQGTILTSHMGRAVVVELPV